MVKIEIEGIEFEIERHPALFGETAIYFSIKSNQIQIKELLPNKKWEEFKKIVNET